MKTNMSLDNLKYIKNVTDTSGKIWAYKEHILNSYFPLYFKQGDNGVEKNALKLLKNDLIILFQKSPEDDRGYLTHLVELVNEREEDKAQWGEDHTWYVFRWVKVHWVTNFNNLNPLTLDSDAMRVDWGCQNTMAKSLEGPNLMKEWGNINNLRDHLRPIFC
jgi:hypothetical protein